MFQLLKIEWLKLKYYRTFWILSGLFVIGLLAINRFFYGIGKQMMQGGRRQNVQTQALAQAVMGDPFNFPDVWQSVTWASGLMLFIPGLLMIISVTNEFNFKTHRQNIIDGWSRTQFVLVKMMLGLIAAVIATVLVLVIVLGFGLTGSGSFSWVNAGYIGYFFIQALSYMLLALLMGLLLKRSGIAIGLFFLYVILDNPISFLVNRYIDPVGSYLPLRAVNNLIPFPFFRRVTAQLITETSSTPYFIASLVYIALFVFISKRKVETDDL